MKVVDVIERKIEATVILTEAEMIGLVKLISPTSEKSRQQKNKMTKEEAVAVEDVFNELSDIMDYEGY